MNAPRAHYAPQPTTAFDPKLIVFQMVAMQVGPRVPAHTYTYMWNRRLDRFDDRSIHRSNRLSHPPSPPQPSQCLYYLLEGGILQGFHLLFGTDVSLAQVFTPKGLEMESAEGLLNMVAVLLSFVAGCVLCC